MHVQVPFAISFGRKGAFKPMSLRRFLFRIPTISDTNPIRLAAAIDRLPSLKEKPCRAFPKDCFERQFAAMAMSMREFLGKDFAENP
jgi:hypothetical protein